MGSRVAQLTLLGVATCALAAGLARAAETGDGPAAEPMVIVLSWDGTRHDYPARAATPALDRMASEGTRAERLVPVFPSNTFPNHVALATGTYPDRHGIVNNRFVDTDRGRYSYEADASWLDAEPIWIAAERQGLRAATFFWVGSETEWHGRAATYRRTPFDATLPESAKVDQIIEWIDLPASERPRLIMSWWHGCDSVGHDLGPNDEKIAQQLTAQDAELGRLLRALDERDLWSRATLLVVSDHGMAEVRETIDASAALDAAGIETRAPLDPGGMAYVRLEDPSQRDRALTTLRALDHVEAYAMDTLPGDMRVNRPGRTGEIVIVTEPPYAFDSPPLGVAALTRLASLLGRSRGTHGYRPDRPDMGAIFYAMGRRVPRGEELPAIRAIDVAPTVAALLDIDPPAQAEGRALFPVATARSPD